VTAVERIGHQDTKDTMKTDDESGRQEGRIDNPSISCLPAFLPS